MKYGDILFYSDSGAFFIKNAKVLIDQLEQSSQDILGFELPLIESQWTKKELFLNMNCNKDYYMSSNQLSASFQLIKKTNFSMEFYKNYLRYSCVEMNLTDIFDSQIKQEIDFIEHRHDQSIFSLMYKKHGLRPYKDPTQFGNYPRGYAGVPLKNNLTDGEIHKLDNNRKYRSYVYSEKYKNIIFHNRSGHPVVSLVKFILRGFLYRLGLYRGRF
jgi:hypothetical protein